MKKRVLKNFAIFIGKHLSESLFFNKVAGLQPHEMFKQWDWRPAALLKKIF